MKIPEMLTDWFTRLYGNNYYIEMIYRKGGDPELFEEIVLRKHLENAAKELKELGRDFPQKRRMTWIEDICMYHWLRSEAQMGVEAYYRNFKKLPTKIQDTIRGDIWNYAPFSCQAIFEEKK